MGCVESQPDDCEKERRIALSTDQAPFADPKHEDAGRQTFTAEPPAFLCNVIIHVSMCGSVQSLLLTGVDHAFAMCGSVIGLLLMTIDSGHNFRMCEV